MVLCGIDEAGRGPVAGPLVMAGVILHTPIAGLNDSKKLSSSTRERLYDLIIDSTTYHIVTLDATRIDTEGLSRCLAWGLRDILASLHADHYLFDGNTTFGVEGISTQVKADETIPQVSAASILAKVHRDRLMVEYDVLYPHYHFAQHKGYGTQAHLDAIERYGLSPIHRKSIKLKTKTPTLW